MNQKFDEEFKIYLCSRVTRDYEDTEGGAGDLRRLYCHSINM